jgi:hypothetical protein
MHSNQRSNGVILIVSRYTDESERYGFLITYTSIICQLITPNGLQIETDTSNEKLNLFSIEFT